jgi:hypothetical protein
MQTTRENIALKARKKLSPENREQHLSIQKPSGADTNKSC